jgi:alpha-1,2-mannosyltransferase
LFATRTLIRLIRGYDLPVTARARVRAGLALLCGVGALVYLFTLFFNSLQTDLFVYLAGAQAVLDGRPLYGEDVGIISENRFLPFTYPPFAAFAVIPFAVVSKQIALAAWFLLSVSALIGIAVMTATRLPALANRVATRATVQQLAILVFVLAAISEPISRNLDLGQVNLYLVVALMYDTLHRTRFTGYLTGIAAGFKVTPGIFILFMLTTRRWADAARAIAGLATTLLIGSVLGINQIVQYWTSVLFDVSRVGESARLSNVSLQGVMYRIMGDGGGARALWLVLAVIILGAGIVVATLWWDRSRLVAVSIVGATSLVISPISWVHHGVWVVPLAGACAALAVRARGASQRGTFWALVVAALLTALPSIIQWRTGPFGSRHPELPLVPFDGGVSRDLVGMGYGAAAVATIAILAVALRLPKGSYEADPATPILRAQATNAR